MNSLYAAVKPLIRTTGTWQHHASQLNPLESPIKKSAAGKPAVFILAGESLENTFLLDWIEQAKAQADIHLVSEQNLIAEKFVRDYPMLDSPGIQYDRNEAAVTGKFSVLLLGFGNQGKALLSAIISNAQFKGTVFRADIADSSAEAFHSFAIRCPDAVKNYHIAFHQMNAAEPEFHQWFSERARDYNRIIVCFGSDTQNMETVNMLRKIFQENRIPLPENLLFARLRSGDLYALSRACPLPFHVFGEISGIYNYDMIVAEKTDIAARQLNAVWSGKNVSPEQEWRNVSFFSQKSSRASAMGQQRILYLLGFTENSAGRPATYEEISAAIEKNIMILAGDEHLRWNAFHLLHGVRPWDLQNPPLASVPVKKCNQIAHCNRHACLVPFDQLPEVDYTMACAVYPDAKKELSPESFAGDRTVILNGTPLPLVTLQGYDMRFVRNIPSVLQKAEIKIYHVL